MLRSLLLASLTACGTATPTDSAATDTGDSGDTGADSGDTGADTADTDTDTADTDTDTADTGADTADTGPCSAPTFAGPAPVVWYSLEDAGAATVLDGAGSHDAASTGTITAVVGKAGLAAKLDGSTAHLDAGVPLSTASFSWAGWVRMDALPSGDFGVIANHGNGPSSYSGWLLVVDPTGVPSIFTEGGSGATEIGTSTHTPLAVGTWVHLAVTFNAGEVFLYVNGNPGAGANLNYDAILDGGNPYVLGHDENNGVRYFAGTLDEVGYWNAALSADEVKALVADGECGLPSI